MLLHVYNHIIIALLMAATVGDKQVTPFQTNSWKEFDPLVLGKRSTYKLMISAVVPRPIALVRYVWMNVCNMYM